MSEQIAKDAGFTPQPVAARSFRRFGPPNWLWIAFTAGCLVAAPIALDMLGQTFYIRVLTRILIFGLAASSLNLVLGYGGMISLGHAAFVGLGSYAVGILAWHSVNDVPVTNWPFYVGGSTNAAVTWPLAVVVSATSAFIIGAISLRTRGLYFIMITLAFAQMIYYFAGSLQLYGGDDGLKLRSRSILYGVDLNDRITFYYLVLASLASALVIIKVLIRSRFGLVIQAARQNETRVRALGIEPYPYQLVCFTISGAIAGVAGVLMANLEMFVSPADLSVARSSEFIAMILLGGLGAPLGPAVGAAFYIVAQFVLGNFTVHWPLLFGPALIWVVLKAPRGLLGFMSTKVST